MKTFPRLSFSTNRKWLLPAAIGLAILVALPMQAALAQSGGCPPGFPEEPVIRDHMSQSDIASGRLTFDEIFTAGQLLFEARFNICDGQGRPATTGGGDKREPDEPAFSRISGPDSNSCAGCHNTPRSGGSGDIVANVFVVAQMFDPVVTTDDAQFSNFRNTPGMFGSGAIEMLAREMTAELLAQRDEAAERAREFGEEITIPLHAKGISFGTLIVYPDGNFDTSEIEGLDPDLILKPFHQAGRVISLREFTNNAMNHHHGMQSEERFDLYFKRGVDYDEDGVAHELTIGDITAITIWQAALGVPGQVLPDDPEGRAEVELGERLFSEIGCTSCHIPEFTLLSTQFVEPNPYNLTGNWADTSQSYEFDMTTTGEGPFLEKFGSGAIIRAYTDLKRHNLCDKEIDHYCNEKLSQGRFDQDGQPGAHYFLTAKLWDAGSSAPYGHVGDLTTLTEAILAHGGEGRKSRNAFVDLAVEDQSAVIRFLKSLQVLPEGMDRVVTESELLARMNGQQAGTSSEPQKPAEPPPAPVQPPGGENLGIIAALLIASLGLGIMIGRQGRGEASEA